MSEPADPDENHPAVVAWRLKHVETLSIAHAVDITYLKTAVARVYGAVALAIVLTPVLSAFAVAFVNRRP